MKRSLAPITFVLLALQNVYAQDSANSKLFIAKVTTAKNESYKGILYAINDSSVLLIQDHSNMDNGEPDPDSVLLETFYSHEILKIKVRRKGAVAKGALIGGGSGMTIGFMIDLLGQFLLQEGATGISSATGTTEPEVGLTPMFTITFGLIGSGIGALIGSSSKKFLIDFDQKKFETSRNALMRYSFSKSL